MRNEVPLYLIGLLNFKLKGTCVEIARALGNVSHDSLTRFLKKNFSGQKLLEFFRGSFPLSGWYLVIDSFEVLHPHAMKL